MMMKKKAKRKDSKENCVDIRFRDRNLITNKQHTSRIGNKQYKIHSC